MRIRLAGVQGWALCLLFLAAIQGRSQVGTYPSSTGSSSNNNRSGSTPNGVHTPGNDMSGLDPSFSHRQMVSRREDLKRHMVDNAARLLMLTRDLQTDLQSREATEADARRLDEIAKLARTVRDEMRQ